MGFIYSAFIENTSEARGWLESIGYNTDYCDRHGTIAAANTEIAFTTDTHYPSFKLLQKEGSIDCRGNFELFKATTAMMDDSDYMQWYCFEQKGEKYKADPYFFLCEGENYIEWAKKQEPFTNTYVLAHKATLSELINHFKK